LYRPAADIAVETDGPMLLTGPADPAQIRAAGVDQRGLNLEGAKRELVRLVDRSGAVGVLDRRPLAADGPDHGIGAATARATSSAG